MYRESGVFLLPPYLRGEIRGGWMAIRVRGEAMADHVDIGSRLELLVDDHLVEHESGDLRFQLHRPVRREVVLRTNAPWEGNASAFQSVFRDGSVYRMYYRGLHYEGGKPVEMPQDTPRVLCYAESDDGIHWVRPGLGLFTFDGSKDNNIVLDRACLNTIQGDPAHTSVYRDTNPDCPADARYKVTVVGKRPKGMFCLKSGDGVAFSLMSDRPAVTEGAFDSQNLIFWDPVRREYREYHRGFRDGMRDILTSVSRDVLHFPEPQWLEYPGAPAEQLYTNAIQPYPRAPHLFVGFPMRYVDRGWSDPMIDLPGLDARRVRAGHSRRFGTALTDGLFMTSRDGIAFRRWGEAFIRPGPRRRHSWVYGDNFTFWGLVETKSAIQDAPDELSLYATEGYWEGADAEIRRYTLRLDGFVSASAPLCGGELVTKPLVFDGGHLDLNLETSAAGDVQVEVQDPGGTPVPGYALSDCPPIFRDAIDHRVHWAGGCDLRPLSGKPVRLRFALRDADLYAFQFVPYSPDPERPSLATVTA